MKIERVNNTDYKIYYYRDIIEENNVKELIKQIQKRLKLKGFYKVIVIYKTIGTFLKLNKIHDTFYKDTLDLKIDIMDSTIYFKTNDYFLIKDLPLVKYKDGMYYCVVDESFDEILEKVEFGDFVFEDEIE